MTAAVRLCIVTGVAAGICHAEGPDLPLALTPEWATPEWIYDAAGIVAGETVPNCTECDSWIACTIVADVEERGYHPWRLRAAVAGGSARWYGWRRPSDHHLDAVRMALGGRCADVPVCAYLGSLLDYAENWRFDLARKESCHVIGNQFGAIVCVP